MSNRTFTGKSLEITIRILIEQRNRDCSKRGLNVVNRPIIMKVMAVTPSVYEAAVLAI